MRALLLIVLITLPMPSLAQRQARPPGQFDALAGPGENTPADACFRKLFDAKSADIVRNPERIEVIRLAGEFVEMGRGGGLGSTITRNRTPEEKGPPRKVELGTRIAKGSEENVAGYAIAFRRPDLSAPLANRLVGLASKPRSYVCYSGTKLCGGFAPKVVFRFWRKAEVVDVLLCFNCGDVGVARAHSTQNEKGDVEVADMGSAEPEWLSIAQAALPDDAFLKDLKAR